MYERVEVNVVEMEETAIESVQRMKRDLRASAKLMTETEARFLVDFYYMTQKNRIRAAHQIRTALVAEEPCQLLEWVFNQFDTVEKGIKSALKVYALSKEEGKWAMSIHGIGPVITAGLMAHIDVSKAKTAGAVWRFAGMDPTVTWGVGEKRPWNASLKRLCFLIGDSFMKHRNSDKDIYGKFYEERKKQEIERNDQKLFREQAEKQLTTKNIKDKDLKACLMDGKLPPLQIERRARRYAVKLFLAHYHHVAFEAKFKTPPPKPYAIAILGHAHEIEVPRPE